MIAELDEMAIQLRVKTTTRLFNFRNWSAAVKIYLKTRGSGWMNHNNNNDGNKMLRP